MEVRTCRVTIRDMEGIDHTAHVTASTLYEAVALGIRAITNNTFSGDLTEGSVYVQIEGPAVEHTVKLRSFYQWLEKDGRSPKEITGSASKRY